MFPIIGLFVAMYLGNLYFLILDINILRSFKNTNIDEGKFQLIYFIVFCIIVMIFIIFAVLNIIRAVNLISRKNYIEIRKNIKKTKYGSIPCFVFNFILVGFATFIMFAASHGFGIFFLPIPVFFTWIVVVISSVYGLGLLLILHREKVISTKRFVIFGILQICFVFDIICTFVMLKDNKISDFIEKN
jgi:hypothetical protein